MHRPLLFRQPHTPFENASKVLLRTARREERKKVTAVERARAQGTSELHKAQYINAFIEARSRRFTQQLRMEQRALLTADAPAPPALVGGATGSLRLLATELEERYGASGPPATEASHRHDRALSSPSRAPVAFGEWRTSDVVARRQSRAADFIPHCILREARTPPGWSPEALRRALPLRADAPAVRRLQRHLRRASHVAASAGEDAEAVRRYLVELRKREQEVAAVWPTSPFRDDGNSGGEGSSPNRSTLACHVLQNLAAASEGWALPLAYLRTELSTTLETAVNTTATAQSTTATGGAYPRRLSRGETAQRIAVLAEAIRYLDLDLDQSPPLGALVQLMEVAVASVEGARLPPVVAAPLLSIARAPGDPDAIQRFTEEWLVHLQRGHKAKGLVYLPAAAWGEYLHALHRSGADTAAIQRAVDTVTDPSRTQHANHLLSNPHVWAGYLASVEGPHALEVYTANRRHYGLRETPATVASVMAALAKDCPGKDSVEKGLTLYRTLRASAGRQVVGTASVLAALAALHAAASDLKALLALCVDYEQVLLYLGVPLPWWAAETGGAELQKKLLAVPATDTAALLSMTPAHRVYFGQVCAVHEVPPLVRHAIDNAITRVEEEWATRLAAEREEVPSLSAEDLADLL